MQGREDPPLSTNQLQPALSSGQVGWLGGSVPPPPQPVRRPTADRSAGRLHLEPDGEGCYGLGLSSRAENSRSRRSSSSSSLQSVTVTCAPRIPALYRHRSPASADPRFSSPAIPDSSRFRPAETRGDCALTLETRTSWWDPRGRVRLTSLPVVVAETHAPGIRQARTGEDTVSTGEQSARVGVSAVRGQQQSAQFGKKWRIIQRHILFFFSSTSTPVLVRQR